MAVYTELSKPFLKELADDYSLGRITSAASGRVIQLALKMIW